MSRGERSKGLIKKVQIFKPAHFKYRDRYYELHHKAPGKIQVYVRSKPGGPLRRVNNTVLATEVVRAWEDAVDARRSALQIKFPEAPSGD